MITWLGVCHLAGGDQRELVGQVARVLHDSGDPPGGAGCLPGAPHMRVVQVRHTTGQRGLARAGRVLAADQAEHRDVVQPVRFLSLQVK
jgi:hypothetical protein